MQNIMHVENDFCFQPTQLEVFAPDVTKHSSERSHKPQLWFVSGWHGFFRGSYFSPDYLIACCSAIWISFSSNCPVIQPAIYAANNVDYANEVWPHYSRRCLHSSRWQNHHKHMLVRLSSARSLSQSAEPFSSLEWCTQFENEDVYPKNFFTIFMCLLHKSGVIWCAIQTLSLGEWKWDYYPEQLDKIRNNAFLTFLSFYKHMSHNAQEQRLWQDHHCRALFCIIILDVSNHLYCSPFGILPSRPNFIRLFSNSLAAYGSIYSNQPQCARMLHY